MRDDSHNFERGVIRMASTVIGLILKSMVLVQLWDWFVIPKFVAAPRFGWGEMWGLVLAVRAISVPMNGEDTKEDPKWTWLHAVTWNFAAPGLLYANGWFIHWLLR